MNKIQQETQTGTGARPYNLTPWDALLKRTYDLLGLIHDMPELVAREGDDWCPKCECAFLRMDISEEIETDLDSLEVSQ